MSEQKHDRDSKKKPRETNQDGQPLIRKDHAVIVDNSNEPIQRYSEAASRTEKQRTVAIGIMFSALLVIVFLGTLAITALFRVDEDTQAGEIQGKDEQQTLAPGMKQDRDDDGTRLKLTPDGKTTKVPKESHNEEWQSPYDNRSGSQAMVRELDWAETKYTTGYQIFNGSDRLTDDMSAVDDITGLFLHISDALIGAPFIEGESGDGTITRQVADDRLYGNIGAASAIALGHHLGWSLDESRIYVVDTANEGVYKVAASWKTSKGDDAYLISGYYDPVIDAIKVASANYTEAGEQDRINAGG